VRERRDQARRVVERYGYDMAGRLRSFRRYSASTPCAATDTTSDTGAYCGSSLSQVAQDTFAYDKTGNRVDSGTVSGTGDRQVTLEGYSFEYDADGNMTRKYLTADANAFDQRFYWNSANELDSVRTRVSGSWSSVAFGYDAFGRRVRKTTSGGATTRYAWDGAHVIAEYDGSANLLWHFTYYAGADRPHSVRTSDGTRHYFMTDGRANTTGLVNSGVSTVEAFYRFRPFGAADSTAGTVTSSLRYAGREYDAETGLYYNRARYYDPWAGRFISEDPAGRAGGTNPYVFADNDPINGRDPTGNWCEWREAQKKATAPGFAGPPAAGDEHRGESLARY